MSQTPRHGTRRSPGSVLRRWRSATATMLAALLAAGALTTLTPMVASAAEGTITDLSVTVTDDGTANTGATLGLDDSATNGLVATNNAVTMTWSLSGEGLTDGVFTQTLPEGWTWDTSTLNKLVSDSSVYKSSYTLSADARTVTATISLPSNALVSITGLRARVSATPHHGDTYTPTLIGTDSTGDRTATAGELTVVSTPQIGFYPGSSSVVTPTTHDFGNGDEDATRLYTYLSYLHNQSTVGQDIYAELALPYTFTMTYDGPEAAEVSLCMYDASSWLRIDSVEGQTVTLTMTAQPPSSSSTRYAALCRWYPKDDVPQSLAEAVTVTTTTSTPDLTLTDGTVMTAAGSVSSNAKVYYKNPEDQEETEVPGSVTAGFGYYNWKAGMSAPSLPINNTTVSSWTQPAMGGNTGTGAYLATKSEYTPPSYSPGYAVQPAANLVGYQFWDATLAQFTGDPADIAVLPGRGTNTSPTAMDPSTYTVQFSPNQSVDGPWYDTVDEAGGVAAVQGVRMALVDTWGEGLKVNYSDSTLRLVVPRIVVWDQLATTSFRVNTHWTADDQPTLTYGVATNLSAVFGSQSITSTPKQLVSGNVITYRVAQGMYQASGTPADADPITVRPGTTKVTLPANITAVDYQDAIDKGWAVASYTEADWGPDGMPGTTDDVHGPIIEFQYTDQMTVGLSYVSLPTFTIVGTTSLQAPTKNSGQVTATAATGYSSEGRGEVTWSSYVTNTMLQVDTLTMDGAVARPVIETTDDTIQFDTNWYNFGKDSKSGAGYILDVLPYTGDGRGTDTTGTLTLQSVTALGDALRGTLEFTTTAPDQIGAHGENATWTALTEDSDLSGATAVRLGLDGLPAGSVGSIRMVLGVTGHSGGDVFVNSGSGWVGDSVTLNSGTYQVRVAESAISGTVWNDVDGDGVRADDESGVAGVTVTLTDADGVPVETTTDDDGGYRFDSIAAGDYTVQVDRGSFSTTVRQTAGPENSTASLTLLSDQKRTGLDFGYTDAQVALTVTGTGTVSDPVVAGGTATLVYTVTNAGGSDLTGIALTDTLDPARATGVWAWPGTEGTLAVGESATYTVSYPVDQTEVDAGELLSTVAATGEFDGLTVSADPADVRVPLTATGALSVQITGAAPATVTTDDQDVTWTAVVTNTGPLTLTDTALATDGIDWTGMPDSLAPGQSATVTATSTLTQAEIDGRQAEIEASATGTTPNGTTVSATGTGLVEFSIRSGSSLVLTVNGQDSVQVTEDDELSWAAVLTNTGVGTLVDLTYSDDGAGLALPSDFDGTLAPGESIELTGTGTALVGDHTVTATLTTTSEGRDGFHVIGKQIDTASYTASAASTASLAGQVRQDRNGDGTLDPSDPGIAGVTVTLLSGATELGSVVTDTDGGYRFADLIAGDYTVRVDRSGVHAGLAEPTVPTSDEVTVTLDKGERRTGVDLGYLFLTPELQVTGEVTAATPSPVEGDELAVRFTVTNLGATDLSAVELVSDLPNSVITGGWDGTDGELPVGESLDMELHTTLRQAQIDAGALTVAADATGVDAADETATGHTDLAIDLPSASALTVTETGLLTGDAVLGGTVQWTATLTNAGATTLASAAITEAGWTMDAPLTRASTQLAPGASVTATAQTTLTQADLDAGITSSQVNATANTLTGTAITGSAQAEVPLVATGALALDLLLNGTAQPTAPGASVTVGDALTWTYTLTNTGVVTLTGVDVTDDLAGRSDLVAAGFAGTLAPGESVTFTTGSAALAGRINDTATAAGTTGTGQAVSATATGWYTATAVTAPPSNGPRILAITGVGLGGAAGLALLLIGAGVLLRRRQDSTVSVRHR